MDWKTTIVKIVLVAVIAAALILDFWIFALILYGSFAVVVAGCMGFIIITMIVQMIRGIRKK